MVHRTTGYGEAFYEVLTAGRTAYQDFDRICHGGDMLKEVEANAARAKPARRRDAVRSNVGGQSLLLLVCSPLPDTKLEVTVSDILQMN